MIKRILVDKLQISGIAVIRYCNDIYVAYHTDTPGRIPVRPLDINVKGRASEYEKYQVRELLR